MILGGMHGNEPLGPAVVEHLNETSESLYPSIANTSAVQEAERYIHCELSTAKIRPHSNKFEERRLPRLIRICNAFPLTIDIHNSLSSEYAFTGPNPEPSLLKVASFLGRSRILLTDYTFYERVPRALGVEFACPADTAELEPWLEQKVPEVCERLGKLATFGSFSELPEVDWDSLEFYRDWRSIDQQEAVKLGLPDYSIQPFEALPSRLASGLGRSPEQPPVHALFWDNLSYGPNFAGLAERCDPPLKLQELLAA